jgi:hypothetical protein
VRKKPTITVTVKKKSYTIPPAALCAMELLVKATKPKQPKTGASSVGVANLAKKQKKEVREKAKLPEFMQRIAAERVAAFGLNALSKTPIARKTAAREWEVDLTLARAALKDVKIVLPQSSTGEKKTSKKATTEKAATKKATTKKTAAKKKTVAKKEAADPKKVTKTDLLLRRCKNHPCSMEYIFKNISKDPQSAQRLISLAAKKEPRFKMAHVADQDKKKRLVYFVVPQRKTARWKEIEKTFLDEPQRPLH